MVDDLEESPLPPLPPDSMEETEEPEDSADGEVQGAEIIILEGEVGVGSAAKDGSVGVVTAEDPRR